MPIDPGDEAAVARLLSHPFVVETLDALSTRPRTQHQLRRSLGTSRSRLAMALRALAAHGTIRRRGEHGSWDDRDDATTAYELTDDGHDLVRLLERMDTWDALYDPDRDSHG